MLSVREMADRIEIQQNVWDYANALDFLDFTIFDRLFVPGARIRIGDETLSVAEAVQRLRARFAAPGIRGYYHLLGSMWIRVTGSEAESLTRCFYPLEIAAGPSQSALHMTGGWLHWHHVRTQEGWRIAGSWTGASSLPGGRVPDPALDWRSPPFGDRQRRPPI